MQGELKHKQCMVVVRRRTGPGRVVSVGADPAAKADGKLPGVPGGVHLSAVVRLIRPVYWAPLSLMSGPLWQEQLVRWYPPPSAFLGSGLCPEWC